MEISLLGLFIIITTLLLDNEIGNKLLRGVYYVAIPIWVALVMVEEPTRLPATVAALLLWVWLDRNILSKKIKIKLFNDLCTPEKHGDWVDLKSGEHIEYKKGDIIKIPLGVAMELPRGYEAHVNPRSSTGKHYDLYQANGQGVIDNPFNGPNDQWSFIFRAEGDGIIKEGERVCQFRIIKKQPPIRFTMSDLEHNEDRGGYGTSGK